VRAGWRWLSGRESRGQLSLALAYASSSQAATRPILLRGLLRAAKPPGPADGPPGLLPSTWAVGQDSQTNSRMQPQQETSGRERRGCIQPKPTGLPKHPCWKNARLSLERGQARLLDAITCERHRQTRSPWRATEIALVDPQPPHAQGLISKRLKQRQLRDDDPSDADWADPGRQRAYSQPSQPQNRRELNYNFRATTPTAEPSRKIRQQRLL